MTSRRAIRSWPAPRKKGPPWQAAPTREDSSHPQHPSVPRPEPRGIPYARAHSPAAVPSKRKGTIPGAASAPPSPLAPGEQAAYEEPIPRAAPLPRLSEVDQSWGGICPTGLPRRTPEAFRTASGAGARAVRSKSRTSQRPSPRPALQRSRSMRPRCEPLPPTTRRPRSRRPPDVRDDDWLELGAPWFLGAGGCDRGRAGHAGGAADGNHGGSPVGARGAAAERRIQPP